MNKSLGWVCAIVGTGLISGCVPITYQKSVVTHYDAAGAVTGRDVTETISEFHQETPRIQSITNNIILKSIDKD
jgi:hypothetical protein